MIFSAVFRIILLIADHRVGRVLSFSQIIGIGTPPTPHLQASGLPPVLGGGAHSLAREGLGESQFRRGDTHCGTLYVYRYVLCVADHGWDQLFVITVILPLFWLQIITVVYILVRNGYTPPPPKKKK